MGISQTRRCQAKFDTSLWPPVKVADAARKQPYKRFLDTETSPAGFLAGTQPFLYKSHLTLAADFSDFRRWLLSVPAAASSAVPHPLSRAITSCMQITALLLKIILSSFCGLTKNPYLSHVSRVLEGIK